MNSFCLVLPCISIFLVISIQIVEASLFLRHDVAEYQFLANSCEQGYFYIYGRDEIDYPTKRCYPPFSDPFENPGDDFFGGVGSSNLANIYFSDFMPHHPCYTSNPENASLFVAIYWNIWRYKSDCITLLTRLVLNSPFWKNPKHRSHHVVYHFWGGIGGTLGHWSPALVAAKDCLEYDPPTVWVNALGVPYPENSTCHIRNPECSIGGPCELSGEDRQWFSNCSFSDNCYLVADRWRDQGMTQVYFENLDYKNVPNLLPIVPAATERKYLVMGSWGIKRQAKKLRSQLTKALNTIPNGTFVLIKHDSNVRRVELDYIINSTFCLVPKGDSPSRRGFSTCLILGSIPIVCSDNFVPPYHNLINWKDVYYRIPERTCADFLYTLKDISNERIQHMFRNVMLIRSTVFFRSRTEWSVDGNRSLAEVSVQPGGPLDMQVRTMFAAVTIIDRKEEKRQEMIQVQQLEVRRQFNKSSILTNSTVTTVGVGREIYLLQEDRQFHLLPDAQTFIHMGLDFGDVRKLPRWQFDLFEIGVPIPRYVEVVAKVIPNLDSPHNISDMSSISTENYNDTRVT